MTKLANRITKAPAAPIREVVAQNIPSSSSNSDTEAAPETETGTSIVPFVGKASATGATPAAITDAEDVAEVVTGTALVVVPQPQRETDGIDFGTIRDRAVAGAPDLAEQARFKKDGTVRRLDSIKDLADGRSDEFFISPFNLFVEEGWNSRDLTTPNLKEHIEWLAKNIAEVGVLQALEVVRKGDRFIILDGHCRYYATMLAISRGCHTLVRVPCKTPRSEGAKLTDHLLSQILRNSGKKLNKVEEAEVIFKLQSHGMFPEEIAQKLSRPVRQVNDLLILRGAPDEIKTWVSHDKVSATQAIRELKDNDEKTALRNLRAMVRKADEGSQTKVTRAIADEVRGKTATVAKPIREANTFLSTSVVRHFPEQKKTIVVLDTETYDKLAALGYFAGVQPQVLDGPAAPLPLDAPEAAADAPQGAGDAEQSA